MRCPLEGEIETITGSDAEVDVSMVPLDSAILGFPVARIERVAIGERPVAGWKLPELQSWLDRHDVKVASSRLASDRLRESMLLEDNGFRFIEMVFAPTLCLVHAEFTSVPLAGIEVMDAEIDDIPAIEAIARTGFSTGRLLLDWRLDAALNGIRYAAWVRNSFGSRLHTVLKATLQDEIVGFFIVERQAGGGVYWHLTALSPAWQGKGIGSRLWATMVERHRVEGVKSIATTISAHNVPVMNIYARLGFRFTSPQMTFHWVRH